MACITIDKCSAFQKQRYINQRKLYFTTEISMQIKRGKGIMKTENKNSSTSN
jgi:hypothetical protein